MDDKKKPSRKPDWTLHQMLIIVLCLQGAAAFFQSAALILTLIRLSATGYKRNEKRRRAKNSGYNSNHDGNNGYPVIFLDFSSLLFLICFHHFQHFTNIFRRTHLRIFKLFTALLPFSHHSFCFALLFSPLIHNLV